MIDNCQEEANKNIGSGNTFHSPLFLQTCLKKFFAYLPFWTKILTQLRFPDAQHNRANNGMVEGYFGKLKTDLKQNHLLVGHFGQIRVTRYIEFQRDRIMANILQINANYPNTKHKRSSKRLKADNIDISYDDLPLQVENWKGKSTSKSRRRKQPVFFSNHSLTQRSLTYD